MLDIKYIKNIYPNPIIPPFNIPLFLIFNMHIKLKINILVALIINIPTGIVLSGILVYVSITAYTTNNINVKKTENTIDFIMLFKISLSPNSLLFLFSNIKNLLKYVGIFCKKSIKYSVPVQIIKRRL